MLRAVVFVFRVPRRNNRPFAGSVGCQRMRYARGVMRRLRTSIVCRGIPRMWFGLPEVLSRIQSWMHSPLPSLLWISAWGRVVILLTKCENLGINVLEGFYAVQFRYNQHYYRQRLCSLEEPKPKVNLCFEKSPKSTNGLGLFHFGIYHLTFITWKMLNDEWSLVKW